MGPVEATTQMKRENILRETTVFEPSVTKSLLFFTVEGRIHDAMHNVHIFRSMLGLLVAYNRFAQGHFFLTILLSTISISINNFHHAIEES